MPRKPRRPCPGRGPYTHTCPNLIRGNESYCSVCAEYAKKDLRKRNRAYDQKRDLTAERKFIHSPQWRKIRRRKLAQDPLCEKCLLLPRETMAVLVHHIDENELNNDPSNLESMCFDCHEAIHHRKGGWKQKQLS